MEGSGTATLVLGVFMLGAVLGANCDRTAAVQAQVQAQQPERYLVADYSGDRKSSYRSYLYWVQVDERTECWVTETFIGYGNGAGQGGGISCLRKADR